MVFSSLICCAILQTDSPGFQDTALVCKGSLNNDSLRHGVWVCYKSGIPVSKERYKNGKLLTRLRFNDKGELIETVDRKGRRKTYKPCGCH